MSIYELYVSKLNKSTDFLWQRPLSGALTIHDPVWYEARRVGHNLLESFMKLLCEEANLVQKIYTNHSIRATCISKLDRAGFEARHITSLSGHKCESTVKEYAISCPEVKKREMFEALVPNKKLKTATVSAPKNTTNIDPNATYTIQIGDLPNMVTLTYSTWTQMTKKTYLKH